MYSRQPKTVTINHMQGKKEHIILCVHDHHGIGRFVIHAEYEGKHHSHYVALLTVVPTPARQSHVLVRYKHLSW